MRWTCEQRRGGEKSMMIPQRYMYDTCEVSVYCVMGGCGHWIVVLKVIGRGFGLAVDILQILKWGSGLGITDQDTKSSICLKLG